MELNSTEIKNKQVVVIDNYDSFTYNLVHIVEKIVDHEISVLRNDEFILKDLEDYDYIILSPGPGIPEEAGLLKEVIQVWGAKKKILGVCLGLQAIGEVYGSKLRNLDKVYHGVSTSIELTDIPSPIFEDINNVFEAGRYHSWVIDKDYCSSDLKITAVDEQGEIMAAQHKVDQVYGLQFHPESIMTPDGRKMLENFLMI